MSGDDVLYAKQKLVELGYLHAATKTTFGTDTLNAVKKFQSANGLEADGIIGALTWAELFGETETREPVASIPGYEVLDRFGDEIKNAIAPDLQAVSDVRRDMCLDALYATTDPLNHGAFPRSLYIRGGNLYNKDLSPNIITISRIRSGADRQPEFYDNGRREMMERAVLANPSITGADCSGGVVGLQRHAGIVKPTFDLAADGFASSASYAHVNAAALAPGDLAHKPGHIGMYVGGGCVVEWAGGAYGCQLTKLVKRRVWDYVNRRYSNQSAWTNFLHATRY